MADKRLDSDRQKAAQSPDASPDVKEGPIPQIATVSMSMRDTNNLSGIPKTESPESCEIPSEKPARLAAARQRSNTNLLVGNDGVVQNRRDKAAQRADEARQLDADVRALAAALHPSLQDNPIVLQNLRFQQKLLGAAELLMDRAKSAGLKGTDWTNLTKMLTAHTTSMAELLSRIPPKDEGREERRVPASVVAWIHETAAEAERLNAEDARMAAETPTPEGDEE